MIKRHIANSIDRTGHSNQAKWRGLTLIELIVVVIILLVLIALLLPAQTRARPAARRTQCKNNLKQIALALHNYESQYGMFPPAFTVDENGHPLHSWRTLILPFLDQKMLYETIDLSKPWNDPANENACKTPVPTFSCPSTVCPANFTTYMGIVATGGFFCPGEPRQISDVTDGPANTVMVFEVSPEHAVHWMAPADADEKIVLGFRQNKKKPHHGGTQVAMVDGTVRFISENLSEPELRALISITGGEKPFEF
jgi:prepilin-type N-terminal cleavage/methylation domain-containing protein